MDITKWYADWQNREHAHYTDSRHSLDNRNLVRNYEAYNDVRLLNERLDPGRDLIFLEVGCATGEFYRYLQIKYPKVKYYGIDISRPAISRAKEKYPQAHFFANDPDVKLANVHRELRIPENPEIIYAKDVVLHQTRPFEFLSELLQIASETVIFRCWTRDVGKTELDPEQSCQYHYRGWMPCIVVNLDKLIAHIKSDAPQGEVIVYRNHIILGGQHNRYLLKDCYLKETGTAETAIGVFKKTDNPGKLVVEDHPDMNPRYTLGYGFRRLAGRILRLR